MSVAVKAMRQDMADRADCTDVFHWSDLSDQFRQAADCGLIRGVEPFLRYRDVIIQNARSMGLDAQAGAVLPIVDEFIEEVGYLLERVKPRPSRP